jgi:hypothetical protein
VEPVLLSGFISANSPREGLGFNSPTFRQINVVYLALSLQSNLARTCILCQGDNLLSHSCKPPAADASVNAARSLRAAQRAERDRVLARMVSSSCGMV